MKRGRVGLVLLGIAVVVAAALFANVLIQHSKTKAAKADVGKIIEMPGGDLQVLDQGPREGPAIVLLHGFAESIHWWDDVAGDLAKNHRVITFDLLGHGGSEKPKSGYSPPSQASLVNVALNELGVKRALVVGQSMGGIVAIAMAESNRPLVEGIVSIASPPEPDDAELPFLGRLASAPVLGEAIRATVPDSQIKNGLENAFADGYEVPDQFVDDVNRMTYNSYEGAQAASRDWGDERSPVSRLQALSPIPLLVIYGAEDDIVEPSSAKKFRAVPGAKIVTVEDAGHSVMVEQPKQTAKLIYGFDARLQSKKR